MSLNRCTLRKQLLKKKRDLEEFRSLQSKCYIESIKIKKEETKILNDIKNLEKSLGDNEHVK